MVEGTYQGAQSYFDQMFMNTGCTYNILQSNQLALVSHLLFN